MQIKCVKALNQGSATYSPQSGSGPPNKVIRPAAPSRIVVQ